MAARKFPTRPWRQSAELLEARWTMSAAPLHFGAVYVEEDFGSDSHGDTFEITFEGGAAGTQLRQLIIDTDHGTPGQLDQGDLVFDTERGGLGADEAFGFSIISQQGVGRITPHVADGSSRLVIDFEGFEAGDKVVLSIDVDEGQDIRAGQTQLAEINDGLDPITSGVEFQGSILTGSFASPAYQDAKGTAEFRNHYDSLLSGTGLNLPADDARQKRDRSAGAVGRLQQQPALASLAGHVYEDRNTNGQREPGEPGLGQVLIRAVPINTVEPQAVREVMTGADGSYRFDGLMPGEYRLVEVNQPAGYLDGIDRAGTIGGVMVGQAVNPGDEIRSIILGGNQHGVDYDFGEQLTATLKGRVHTDQNENCLFDPEDEPLAGVRVDLLNEGGVVVQTTLTDEEGFFEFRDLQPGVYSLHEERLEDFFHIGQVASGGNGITSEDYWIREIQVGAGQDLTDYRFCEQRPVEISGFVFQDGAPISLELGEELPPDLNGYRDGVRTDDDTPLAGVTLELRRTDTGLPVMGSNALPGQYADDKPIVVTTDERGHFQFAGLRHGSYVVRELQPSGYEDGIDTATDGRGQPINRTSTGEVTVPPPLEGLHNFDLIYGIDLAPGESSQENNFSEIVVDRPPPPYFTTPPRIPVLPPPVSNPPAPYVAVPYQIPKPLFEPLKTLPFLASGLNGTTWHLSVINAGMPRGPGQEVQVADLPWGRARTLPVAGKSGPWQNDQWFLFVSDDKSKSSQPCIGCQDGIALAGDFDGDGKDELAIYDDGRWYVDLNGNGRWDAEDLWSRLGRDFDQPVTGDWDGDGKDDIGIYGPSWIGDPRALAAEPGLPDLENPPRGVAKNIPPQPDDATDGRRVLQRTESGRIRADVIDHVFKFGHRGDQAVAGDWNGDGIASVGIFRRGRWRLDVDGDGRWTSHDRQAAFGEDGDTPIAGDFNGDGVDEIAFVRNGRLYIDSNLNGRLDAEDRVIELPAGDGQPVAGDFNGDGVDEIALFRSSGPAEPVIAGRPSTER
ncbi:MAG: SdrD B-like domain-containing protein [Pirellulales bacterium]